MNLQLENIIRNGIKDTSFANFTPLEATIKGPQCDCFEWDKNIFIMFNLPKCKSLGGTEECYPLNCQNERCLRLSLRNLVLEYNPFNYHNSFFYLPIMVTKEFFQKELLECYHYRQRSGNSLPEFYSLNDSINYEGFLLLLLREFLEELLTPPSSNQDVIFSRNLLYRYNFISSIIMKEILENGIKNYGVKLFPLLISKIVTKFNLQYID